MRVLVVKLSSLGDILHVLPTVLAVKAQTGADIDWAVHPEFAALVRTFACVRRVVEFPRRRVARSLGAAVRALRGESYDLVLDLHGLLKSAIVARLARLAPGGRRIAPSYAREGSSLFFRERAGRLHRDCHAAVQAFDTLDYLGLKRPETVATAPGDFLLPETAPLGGSPKVAIAPVSRWPSKNWPAGKFAEFARLLAEARPGAEFAVVGGVADRETGEAVASALPGRIRNLCGKTSIAETMSVLAQCDILVSNDSGPVHMAAAVGTKCLVVFGSTRPTWTGPLGEGHRVVAAGLPCQPCLRRRCPRGDLACLAAVTPSQVCSTALEMLGANNRPPSGQASGLPPLEG